MHIKWLSGLKNGLASGRKVKKSFTFFEAELYQEISCLFIFSIGWFQCSLEWRRRSCSENSPHFVVVVYMLPFQRSLYA